MKAVIIGVGYIACSHASALRQLGVEISWAVGRNAGRALDFAERFGIPHHTTDLDEALRSDAGIVHICTPPAGHAELIRKCLAAGKHVICEKPLCMSAEEAGKLAEEARASGLVTALCCNVRYYPANLEIARRVRDGEAGRPLVISGSYLQEFHAPPHADGWRFDPVLSGGQRAVSEIGTHWIDLSYAWTGKRITAVTAKLGNWYPVRYRRDGMLTEGPEGEPVRVDTEDAAAIIFEFEGGAIGTLLLSEVSRGHGNDLSIEVSGTEGSFRWEEANASVISYSRGGAMSSVDTGSVERDRTFLSLFSDVYAAAEGKPHGAYPSFDDGAYIARICEAITKSGETGERVTIQ